jgi:hypothetical protein
MPPVVVVSECFWRMHLGEDSQAVGRTLWLNGRMATIVGIGPKDFLGVWPKSESGWREEAVHMIRKGQARWVGKGDPLAQLQFIDELFGMTI